MAKIDFFTFIAKGSAKYADFLYRCANALKSGKHDISWKFIQSGSYSENPFNFKIAGRTPFCLNPSQSHALAMNEAVRKSKADYVILSDADISLLYKSWDDIVVKKLKKECSLFGFGSDDSNNWNRVVTVPNVMFFCFRNNLVNFKNIDFSPKMINGKIMKKRVRTKEGQLITGVPIGRSVECETGYKVAKFAYDNQWKSQVLKTNIKKKRYKLLDGFDEEYKKMFMQLVKKDEESMAEWYFNDELFGTHLRKSRGCKYGEGKSIIWINNIINFLNNKYNMEFDLHGYR